MTILIQLPLYCKDAFFMVAGRTIGRRVKFILDFKLRPAADYLPVRATFTKIFRAMAFSALSSYNITIRRTATSVRVPENGAVAGGAGFSDVVEAGS